MATVILIFYAKNTKQTPFSKKVSIFPAEISDTGIYPHSISYSCNYSILIFFIAMDFPSGVTN